MKTAKRIQRFLDEITEGDNADGDPLALGLMDSLAIEQLIAFLEESFDVEFDDEELVAERFASISTVADFVDAKRHARK
jgi:acyl carrier protein